MTDEPKMMPGQTPYTDAERATLYQAVADAAAGDPGEANEPEPGWFGLKGHLDHFLRTVGADTDEQGRFLIAGSEGCVAVGIGGQDVVVASDAVYFVGGKAAGLARNLRGTSYGHSVMVL